MKLKSRVIVVGVDFSELSDSAFRQAYDLAVVSPFSEIHGIFVRTTAAATRFTSEIA
jgi:hypothetical protein